ncbi:hypothetical protein DEU56DRAFT_433788 [Suillus clintonianus]|uniref:uncharacterized protein n=1 Tax=Suillus clintonianus TaxID=1904413 RepID=UPI001B883203|nr:uncharacterized protein DEU56DRAFT_433788 [Suillus clintonianus]KAG2154022.1 hypothetical protein DEU56DRAFT_433788 [Suillus clintonianus]
MHPALGNLEIIYTICSYTQHGSLTALASTCRTFERPALNILWRHLQSLKPFIKCLPSDLFGSDQGRMVLQKPLNGEMWDTLFKYTSRVHSIAVTQSRRLTVIIEPLSLLMLSCPLAPAFFFPNLRKLTWFADGTHDAAEFLRAALVPSLLALDLQISSASSAFLFVISSLGTLCPHLQDMAVRIQNRTDDSFRRISPFITQPISQLHHLHALSVWDLGNQGVEHVMHLQALKSLCLDLGTLSACERKSHLQFPGFHDLDFLCLSTDTFKRVSNFLNSLRVVESKEIQVNFNFQAAHSSASGPTMLSQFFIILQERCDNDRLEGFTLVGISGKVQAKTGVLTPLQACRNLTRLSVEQGCDISISDEELCQLVREWPKLEVLKVSSYVADNSTTMPTLHGLIALLRLCPSLTSLALVVDATKLDGINLKCPGGGRCNKHLKHLALGNSPVGSSLHVALILSGLFPHLEQVNFDYGDRMQTMKKSAIERRESVQSFLSGFSIVRERYTE